MNAFEPRGRLAVVTGAGGFIGQHLVRRLLDTGWQVVAVDRKPVAFPAAETVRCDLTRDELSWAHQPIDVIFHLAGSSSVAGSVVDPPGDLSANTAATVRLLHALASLTTKPRLVVFSSAAVYGNPTTLPIRESAALAPISPYGASKLAAETYAQVYHRHAGVPVSVVRPFSVYGPGLTRQVVYDLLSRLSSSPSSLSVTGTGRESRDFVHVDDVVDAAIAVALRGQMRGEAYNVASGQQTTIANLVELLCQLTAHRPHINYTDRSRPGDPLCWHADIGALNALGYAPTIALETGLRRLIDWYQQAQVGAGATHAR